MQHSQPAPENERLKSAATTPFFRLAHDPLCLLDSGGRVVAINGAFSSLLGYEQDDAAGVAFLEWVHPEERRASVAVLGAALASREVNTFTARLRAQAGHYQPLFWNVVGQGGHLFLVGQALPPEGASPPADERPADKARRQAASLEAVAAITSTTATRRELDQLLQEAVDVTQQRFGLTHTQLYLLNTAGDALELVAEAGESGRQMAAADPMIALHTDHSPVARAARDRQSVLANDLPADDLLRPPELLPATRSVMALPMLAGNQLVGVLALQDVKSERFDEADAAIFAALAAQIAVAVENARSFARAQAAVAETNSLMRRLTREGWEDYLRQQAPELVAPGFLFDAGRVTSLVPVEGEKPVLEGDSATVLDTALQVHDEVIGQLSLVAADGLLFDEEAVELAAAIADQLSARIENLRLTNATQHALTETAALFSAGTELNRARSYEEVLEVMREQSVAGRGASSLALVLFDQPLLPGRTPGRLDVAAQWFDPAAGDDAPTYPQPILAAICQTLEPDDMIFTGDLAEESRLERAVRDYFAGTLGAQSALVVQLVAGGHWIGYLAAAYGQRISVTGSELQRLRTLIGQASVAIQSISLLQAAQQRARRERVLREVSTRVRSVTDVDLILKTAVREIGQALGRETFLYLGDEEPGTANNGGEEVNGDE